uniref:Nudix hydrolase domain-containing protein n=1 Tax=Aplanochytrium stocchinoi TaxID=215587 RepID=A0A7S3PLP5_9STRA
MKGHSSRGATSSITGTYTGRMNTLLLWSNNDFLKGLVTGICITMTLWTVLGMNVRNCERVRYYYSNDKPGDSPTSESDNTLYLENSTRNINGQQLAKYFPVEKFRGDNVWETDKTRKRQVMFETSRLRLEMHSVEINHNKIDDWLFVEIPNQINVLVEFRGQFLVFNQTKYGLKGWSLAPVGGYIEPGETPQEAAVRELNEELQLVAGALHYLGTFRVDVNRGCGQVSLYLAANCKKIKHELLDSDDLEIHDLKSLSYKQLKESYARSAFQEVKWTATVGLGLNALAENERVYRAMSSKFKLSTKFRMIT